jgi:prepilin signal peptidase PulO-like enzyme (type II secretory pathway)
MYLIETAQPLGTIIFFVLGLLFGSFATMASHRIPLNEELVFTPSHCPRCNHKLGLIDLFPVFSWLFNKGRCHYCKSNVHWRYPAIELLMASLFISLYWKTGFSIETVSLCLMTVFVIISLVMLLEKQQISNLMIFSLLITALLYNYSIDASYSNYYLYAISLCIISLSLLHFITKNKNVKTVTTPEVLKVFITVVFFIHPINLISFILLAIIMFLTAFLLLKKNKKKELQNFNCNGSTRIITVTHFTCMINN